MWVTEETKSDLWKKFLWISPAWSHRGTLRCEVVHHRTLCTCEEGTEVNIPSWRWWPQKWGPEQWAEDKVWAWLLEAWRSKGWKVFSLKVRGGKEGPEGEMRWRSNLTWCNYPHLNCRARAHLETFCAETQVYCVFFLIAAIRNTARIHVEKLTDFIISAWLQQSIADSPLHCVKPMSTTRR